MKHCAMLWNGLVVNGSKWLQVTAAHNVAKDGSSTRKGPWLPVEIQSLKQAEADARAGNGFEVSRIVATRNNHQCYARWQRYKHRGRNRELEKRVWSPDEDEALRAAFQ